MAVAEQKVREEATTLRASLSEAEDQAVAQVAGFKEAEVREFLSKW